MARAQDSDEELRALLESDTGLELKPLTFPSSEHEIYCDVSGKVSRPYVPKSFRRRVFDVCHGLSHPGVKATTDLVRKRFVWKNLSKDCKNWCKRCLPCQKSKVQRHTKTSVQSFPLPDARFSHIHIDIVGPLPPSRDCRYLLTCVE